MNTRQRYRIIVEGMDGSGKSTLIKSLMAEFPPMEIIRNELGPAQDFDHWWPEQLERLESPVVPVHDRFFYSELVYGPILRGHLTASANVISNVFWFLRANSLLIYCRPDTDDLRRGIGIEPQMEGVNEEFMALLGLYDEIMGNELPWYNDRFITYDWSHYGLDAVLELVGRYLKGDLR